MHTFKAYDIRGIYRHDLDESLAYDIGQAFVSHLAAKKVVVGHDMRIHSPTLCDAMIQGMMALGTQVISIGLCSTPMLYFANAHLDVDGSVMVTASHNPAEWNGFKLCRESAMPVSRESGLREIEERIKTRNFLPPRSDGNKQVYQIHDAYTRKLEPYIQFTDKPKIVMDFANAMGSIEVAGIRDYFRVIPLYEAIDGSFPNHEANPLNPTTLVGLSQAVQRHKAAFGVAFDGDGDRCCFIDECGRIIPMDLSTALFAQAILEKEQGKVLYDLRSSWIVAETIEASGGKAIQSRVGHAFIKRQMRDCNAIFAGELAGHYYFRDMSFSESSALALIMMSNIIHNAQQTLSELLKPLRKYANSGELNFTVQNIESLLEKIASHYKNGEQSTLDGIKVEFENWWFNIRPSNTEPLLRLIVEAKELRLMQEKRDELISLIKMDNQKIKNSAIA